MSNFVEMLIEQGVVTPDEIDPVTGLKYYPDLYLYEEWKKEEFHSYTTVDWLVAFGIKGRIKSEISNLNWRINELAKEKRNRTEFERLLIDDSIELLNKDIRKLKWSLKKDSDELDVEKAKSVPITDFVQVNRMGKAKCPLHNERTASFQYYKKNNSWYCFGCNEGGDVISLVMKLENLNFVEAVRKLT